MYINNKNQLKSNDKNSFPCCFTIPTFFQKIQTHYNWIQCLNFKPCVRHLECFERDKKRYPGQKTISRTKNDIRDKKRYQGDISFLFPPIINLIKAQVCDKKLISPHHSCDIYKYTKRITICPPGYHHNGFMATPELGHMQEVYIYIRIYTPACLQMMMMYILSDVF